MGYEFECKHVVPGCEGKVTGESRDDVLEAATAHAAEAHGLTDLPGEVVEKVKAGIAEAT